MYPISSFYTLADRIHKDMATTCAVEANWRRSFEASRMEPKGTLQLSSAENWLVILNLAISCWSCPPNANHYPCIPCYVCYSQRNGIHADHNDRRIQKSGRHCWQGYCGDCRSRMVGTIRKAWLFPQVQILSTSDRFDRICGASNKMVCLYLPIFESGSDTVSLVGQVPSSLEYGNWSRNSSMLNRWYWRILS